MKTQKHTPLTCSALNGREVAQILGLVSALAAMTYATPSLIIRSLSGVLWTSAEEKELLAEAVIFEPLMRRITEDMLRTPNVEVSDEHTRYREALQRIATSHPINDEPLATAHSLRAHKALRPKTP